jgi:hypothetical protein
MGAMLTRLQSDLEGHTRSFRRSKNLLWRSELSQAFIFCPEENHHSSLQKMLSSVKELANIDAEVVPLES